VIVFFNMTGIQRCFCGELPAAGGNSQIKALCLLNLAKYVDWPAQVFPETNSPIVIGIIGENKFEDDLKDAMEGKCIGGRKDRGDGGGQRKGLPEMPDSLRRRLGHHTGVESIEKASNLCPSLTVRGNRTICAGRGNHRFTTRDEKVRFVIDLNAARAGRIGG